MRTHVTKPSTINRKWHLIDAKGQVLGRLSSQISILLMGKHKVDFARNVDMGDHVVVINALQVTVTGNKSTQKVYRRHSGFPGGFSELSYAQVTAAHPDRIITNAVAGMLPDNKLKDRVLRHLHVYPNDTHPYSQHFQAKV